MWYDRFSVTNKTVLLTGATGSIGMGILGAFLEAGATVCAVTRREDTDWRGLQEKFPHTLVPMLCNLSDHHSVVSLAQSAEKVESGVDVLINCASDCPHHTENIYDINVLRDTWKVSLEAAYTLCGFLAPCMAQRKSGSIINFISMNALMAWPANPSYITSKSALRMFTKAVARDYGEHGVRANNLCPGYVHSRMTDGSFTNPQAYEERRSHTMLGRWGTVDDMVGPCLFLASDASRYMTGSDLIVDGGWTAKGL